MFLTYQTPKPDRMEPKPNAIGRFSVPSLQISFGAQYVKTEILDLVQKLSLTSTEPNRTEPNQLLRTIRLIILEKKYMNCTLDIVS